MLTYADVCCAFQVTPGGFLREAKIVVDVVVLGGARAGDLAAIARYTGGLVLLNLCATN